MGLILKKIAKSDEARIDAEVQRLFNEHPPLDGQLCRNPVVGGEYIGGEEPLAPQMAAARRALRARAWFALNGPPGAAPLPLSLGERESLKLAQGLLCYLEALYARSLARRAYNFMEHPYFDDYAAGVLWEAEQVDGIIGSLPRYPDQLPALKKQFPPRRLAGMGPGFCWEPPAEHERTMASYRRSLARSA
jgi:hypothetical protein